MTDRRSAEAGDEEQSEDGEDSTGHGKGRRSPEQITRNWNELLQELRVVQTGVQILTGFLLTVPFSQRFTDLTESQQRIYLGLLVGAVLTTALIVAPVAFHRVLFRQRQREWLVTAAHVCARVGLAGLGLVSSTVVLLVFDIVASLTAAVVAAVAVGVTFAVLWFAVPVVAGHRNDP